MLIIPAVLHSASVRHYSDAAGLLFLRPRDSTMRECPVIPGEFSYFEVLIGGDIGKNLRGLARGPVNLKGNGLAGLAEADVLFERIGAEARAAVDVAKECLRLLARRGDLDASANGGVVGLVADEFDVEPVVGMPARVLEKRVVKAVSGDSA